MRAGVFEGQGLGGGGIYRSHLSVIPRYDRPGLIPPPPFDFVCAGSLLGSVSLWPLFAGLAGARARALVVSWCFLGFLVLSQGLVVVSVFLWFGVVRLETVL